MHRACGCLALGLVGVAALFRADFAPAQSAPSAATTAVSTPLPEYHPSMGDLMTMAVQPRHTKLGLAGGRANWVYATYELAELRNAFARIARTIPAYNSSDTAVMIAAMTQAPLAALDQAIKVADGRAFSSAYAQLTAACNACHAAQAHAMVVIQVPKGAGFADQNFDPPEH